MKINKLSWAVAYKIDKKTQDDGITKVVTVAKFNTAEAGANFIKKCLPEETKERFFACAAVRGAALLVLRRGCCLHWHTRSGVLCDNP